MVEPFEGVPIVATEGVGLHFNHDTELDMTEKLTLLSNKDLLIDSNPVKGSISSELDQNSSNISPRTQAIGLLADSCIKFELDFVASDKSIELKESFDEKSKKRSKIDIAFPYSIPFEAMNTTHAIRYNRPRAATISYSLFAPMEPEFEAAEKSRMNGLSWLASLADDEATAADLLSQLSSHRFSSITMSPQAALKSSRTFGAFGRSLGKRPRDRDHKDKDTLARDGHEINSTIGVDSGDDAGDDGENKNMEDAIGGLRGSDDACMPTSLRKGQRRGRSNSVPDIFLDTFGSVDHTRQLSTGGSDRTRMERSPGYIGIYSPEERKRRIKRFLEKRSARVWTKKVKYDVRKNFADSRIRVKGRFIRKQDEANPTLPEENSRDGGSARSGDCDNAQEDDDDQEDEDANDDAGDYEDYRHKNSSIRSD